MYHHAALLANIPIDDDYTPAGAWWWKERLTPSEISAVIHTLVDALLTSTALPPPGREYFDMAMRTSFCAHSGRGDSRQNRTSPHDTD